MDIQTGWKNILVSRLRFLGDIVLSTPLLRALCEGLPGVRVFYMAEAAYARILEHHPYVNELITINKAAQHDWPGLERITGKLAFITKLRSRRLDLTIDLLGSLRSALLLWVTGAGHRIGFNYRGRRYLYNLVVERDSCPKSAIEFHLDALKPLGIPKAGTRTELYTAPAEDTWAKNYLRAHGISADRPLFGMHLGASWPAKRWFPERFAELAHRLVAECGAQVIFTVGPGEEQLVSSIIHTIERASATEVLPVRQVLALLKQMHVYVSNDCGIMHVSAAVGTPTVGIFGPSEPEIWFPYDPADGHHLVHKEILCSRCHRDFCDNMECMRAISVEEVFEAATEALNWKEQRAS